jgi:hypothetical protein
LATAGQDRPAVVVVRLDRRSARSATPEADLDPARPRSIPVLPDLGDDEIAHIAALAAEASMPEDDELVCEGDCS